MVQLEEGPLQVHSCGRWPDSVPRELGDGEHQLPLTTGPAPSPAPRHNISLGAASHVAPGFRRAKSWRRRGPGDGLPLLFET